MENPVINQLIEFLKTVSPVVWSSLIKQVYSEAISTIIWGIVFGIIGVIFYKIGIKLKVKVDENRYENCFDEDDIPWIILFVISGILEFVFIGNMICAIQYFVNPEFYAIKFILSTFK